MKFKKATADDAKTLLEITHTAFMRYANEVGQSVAGTTENLDDILSDIEHKDVYLAIHEGQTVGSIRVQMIEDIAYLSRFCALPNTEGLQIGRNLMEHLKNKLKVNALVLHTGTKLTRLVIFYYRCGFYVHSVSHQRGYPRGLFVCKLGEGNPDYDSLTQGL